MICNSVQDVLILYIKSEISADQIHEVERHLAGCSACQKEIKILQQMDNLVTAGANVHSAPDLQIGSNKYPKWLYYASAAVILLLVSLIVVYFITANNDRVSSENWASSHMQELHELNYDMYQISASTDINTNTFVSTSYRQELDNLNYNLHQISID